VSIGITDTFVKANVPAGDAGVVTSARPGLAVASDALPCEQAMGVVAQSAMIPAIRAQRERVVIEPQLVKSCRPSPI
jgi:hypothetical protein